MTDPSFTSEADRDLLVVLHSREQAEEAAQLLLDAGIAAEDVQVDREPDRVVSLRAEMHEELAQAWVVPNAGVAYTKEAARGLVAGNLIGVSLGILAAFPLALIPIGDTSYATRLAVFLVVGVAFGMAIGLVAGPAAGATKPIEPAAVEEGTLLRVRHDSHELRTLLASLHPIRIDEIRRSDDLPIAAVAMDEGGTVHDTVEDLTRSARGDDYQPDPDAPIGDRDVRPTPTSVDPETGEATGGRSRA